LLFLFCSNIGAQDSLAVAKKQKIVFTEKNIVVDSAFITLKPFDKNFKSKYTDEAFIYRFKEWLANFLPIFSVLQIAKKR
jgi:hypothetical protein